MVLKREERKAMRFAIIKKFLLLLFCFIPLNLFAFSANWVDISRRMNGIYRVTIWYTHLTVGEYRIAIIDFRKSTEAIETFRKLARGADFYFGDSKTQITFQEKKTEVKPY